MGKGSRDKTMECPVCGKHFPRGLLDLTRHVNAITLQHLFSKKENNQYSFGCSKCNLFFTKKEHLEMHNTQTSCSREKSLKYKFNKDDSENLLNDGDVAEDISLGSSLNASDEVDVEEDEEAEEVEDTQSSAATFGISTDDLLEEAAAMPKKNDMKTMECMVCGKLFPRGPIDLHRHATAITLKHLVNKKKSATYLYNCIRCGLHFTLPEHLSMHQSHSTCNPNIIWPDNAHSTSGLRAVPKSPTIGSPNPNQPPPVNNKHTRTPNASTYRDVSNGQKTPLPVIGSTENTTNTTNTNNNTNDSIGDGTMITTTATSSHVMNNNSNNVYYVANSSSSTSSTTTTSSDHINNTNNNNSNNNSNNNTISTLHIMHPNHTNTNTTTNTSKPNSNSNTNSNTNSNSSSTGSILYAPQITIPTVGNVANGGLVYHSNSISNNHTNTIIYATTNTNTTNTTNTNTATTHTPLATVTLHPTHTNNTNNTNNISSTTNTNGNGNTNTNGHHKREIHAVDFHSIRQKRMKVIIPEERKVFFAIISLFMDPLTIDPGIQITEENYEYYLPEKYKGLVERLKATLLYG